MGKLGVKYGIFFSDNPVRNLLMNCPCQRSNTAWFLIMFILFNSSSIEFQDLKHLKCLSKHKIKRGTAYCLPLSTSVWQRYFLALRWSGQLSRANSKSVIAFMMLPLLAYLRINKKWKTRKTRSTNYRWYQNWVTTMFSQGFIFIIEMSVTLTA